MARKILTLADLGYESAWLLVQQACGIPDARARSTFLENTTTVLFFASDSLPERLCVTGAVRQMGGHVVYMGPGPWQRELDSFPQELSIVASYYVDVVVAFGLPVASLRETNPDHYSRPLLNAGSPESHPVHALADIACMQQYTPDLKEVSMAWVGCANGTLFSLVEATRFFHYGLRVALPQDGSPVPALLLEAQQEGRISLVNTPLEAITDANYICAGCIGGTDLPAAQWKITNELMSKAAYKARILLSSSPTCCIPIASDVLQSKASLLGRQAENRLRVTKRTLHLLLEE